MMTTSADDGKTWSPPTRLPDGILGPIKNKPVQLASGDILSPTSVEGDGGWRVHFERSSDLGKTWSATPPVNDGKSIGAIQPSILFHPNGKLQSVGRTKNDKLFEIWSDDGGTTWGKMSLTDLPNPNSGTDAVTLRDGRQLLARTPKLEGVAQATRLCRPATGRTEGSGRSPRNPPPKIVRALSPFRAAGRRSAQASRRCYPRLRRRCFGVRV